MMQLKAHARSSRTLSAAIDKEI